MLLFVAFGQHKVYSMTLWHNFAPINEVYERNYDLLGEPGHATNIKDATVVGWGTTYNETKDNKISIAPTPIQQYLDVPLVNHQECVRKWRNIGIREFSEHVR